MSSETTPPVGGHSDYGRRSFRAWVGSKVGKPYQRRRIYNRLGLLLFLLAIGWAAYHWNVFHVRDQLHAWRYGSHQTVAPKAKPLVASVPRGTKPAKPAGKPPVKAAGPNEGKHCVPEKDPKAVLAGRRATAHTMVNGWLKHHQITEAEAKVINGDIDTHPGRVINLAEGFVSMDWSVTVVGRTKPVPVTVYDQCTCKEWAEGKLPPKSKPPVIHRTVVHRMQHVRVVPKAPAEQLCFPFYVDGRRFAGRRAVNGVSYPGLKMPLHVTMEFYQHGGGTDDLFAAMNGRCLYAVDMVTKERLYLNRVCTDCSEGKEQRIWPRDVRVNTNATLIVQLRSKSGKAGCPSGYCVVYLPFDWVRELSVLWCFETTEEYIGADDNWEYDMYYNRVSQVDILADLSRGKYRTITPAGILGFKGQVLGKGYSE